MRDGLTSSNDEIDEIGQAIIRAQATSNISVSAAWLEK